MSLGRYVPVWNKPSQLKGHGKVDVLFHFFARRMGNIYRKMMRHFIHVSDGRVRFDLIASLFIASIAIAYLNGCN